MNKRLYKSNMNKMLDSGDEKARIASFVAVAPMDDPQFLCLICLDEPHSWTTTGGSLSAPPHNTTSKKTSPTSLCVSRCF